MIKNIVFDIGNVLVRFQSDEAMREIGIEENKPDAIAVMDKAGKDLAGSLRCLNANYISYLFDFKGPSFVIDTACSSSGYAADVALKSIQNGECDQAILAGTNLLLGPTLSLVFLR